MNAKPSITFLTQSSDGKLAIALGHILDAMLGNTHFVNPVPTLADIGAARDTYVTAVNALDRSRATTVARDNARAAVVQLVRDLALYVQQTSKGDMATLLTSGFPAQKSKRQPAGVLLAPQNVRLRTARISGQMLARARTVPEAKAYQWRYATALAPTVWTVLDPVTTASITLVNLTPGTNYIVQARAIGTRGSSDWSDGATLMVV